MRRPHLLDRGGFVMRYLFGLTCILALSAAGCSETAGTGGVGGSGGIGGGGSGGIGGGGSGGDPIVACLPTEDRCENAPILPHEPCCEHQVPDQANACNGTESTQNPATCTPTGDTVTHRVTLMELEGDCNVGYDLDDCQGRSCVPTGITQEDGLSGVDNAFAGIGLVIAGVGGDLRGFNRALSDALCGRRDDVERGDCLLETPPLEIRFVVDANASEDCVNVTVLADDEASAHILNLNDDGCASGTLGTIPITIRGEEGSLENTVVRMTVSPAGFSHGLLGAVMDEYTATIARESLGVTAAVDWPVLDIDASTPPVRDASAACNGLSVTLVIGGVAQIASP